MGLCNVNSVNVDYMIVFISGALFDPMRLLRKIKKISADGPVDLILQNLNTVYGISKTNKYS